MGPLKKTKFSKKTKKAWRFTDIADVENFYEDKLHEERLGGPLRDKHDDKLFVIDKDSKDLSKLNKNEKLDYYSARERKRRAQQAPRCFQSLENTSKVEDPISKRNRLRTKEERKSSIQKAIESKRREKEIDVKEQVSSRKRRSILRRKKQKAEELTFKKNVWKKKEIDVGEWLEEDTTRHYLSNTGQLEVKVPKLTHMKPSELPSIEIPHSGSSYNPSRRAHTELQREISEQKKKRREEENRLKKLTSKLTKISQQKRESDWLKEMSSGLEEAKKKQNEIEDDGTEYKAVNPPAQLKIKPLKKRKRAKELRKEKIEKREQKIEKKKISDLYRLRFFEKEIAEKEEKSAAAKQKRVKKKASERLKTKVLGKIKFAEPITQIKPRSELKNPNLRKLAPRGSILSDRFLSLQKRNIMEPRVRTGRIHKKVGKSYFKKGYKMDEEKELEKYTS